MKIALFGNCKQNAEHVLQIFSLLKKNSAEVYIQDSFYDYISKIKEFSFKPDGIISKDNDFLTDIAISIGGDGTFLQAASFTTKRDIPVLGINTGRLGFLADNSMNNIEETFKDIFSDNYKVESRSRLELITEHKDFKGFNYALNEVAILKQDIASMITIHSYINDEYLSTYQADGLIIATPTGSTAYSLSVGGPIMAPNVSNFIIAAVAPHSLTSRPLIISDDCIIKLNIESRNNNFLISLDGRCAKFTTGIELKIKKANYDLKVIKRMGHTFYGTLRDKLMWGVDPRKKNN